MWRKNKPQAEISTLDDPKQLPDSLTDLIDAELSVNKVGMDGNIFLSDKLSEDINAVLDGNVAATYHSKVLDKPITLIGYYEPQFKDMNKDFAANSKELSLEERKQQVEHVYFSMPLNNTKKKKKAKHDLGVDMKSPISDEDFQKGVKILEGILDRKSMNSEGYVFLTENERDELGKEFLLKVHHVELPDYAFKIAIGGVKPEVETEMERRYADYSFDQLTKYKELNTIVYPIWPNQKVEGAVYKMGIQTMDKKKLPLFFWFLISGICFAAAICIIIWIFGFVVNGAENGSILYNTSPPVDGALVIQSLFPNAWTFLSHIAASITIFAFLFYFGWRPVKSAIEKRENYIASQISNAERLNKEADIKLEYVTQQAAIVYAKSNEMMENVTRQANLEKEKAAKELKEQRDTLLKNAHDDAEKIHANMQSQINKEIANNSIMIASELLKRNLTSEDNEQFVNDFINNISHNNSNNSTEPK